MHTIISRVSGKKLYTLFRTDSCKIECPVYDREDKNHTLSSGTSPYMPYKGVPPDFLMGKMNI